VIQNEDDYHSDWAAGDGHVTGGNIAPAMYDQQVVPGYEEDLGDQFIAGQSLTDDAHDVDRYVARVHAKYSRHI